MYQFSRGLNFWVYNFLLGSENSSRKIIFKNLMNFSAVDLAETFGTNVRAFWNFSSECTRISTR